MAVESDQRSWKRAEIFSKAWLLLKLFTFSIRVYSCSYKNQSVGARRKELWSGNWPVEMKQEMVEVFVY